MKVFTFYYDRFTTATTSKALKDAGVEHTIVCHNQPKRFENIFGKIVATGNPTGLAKNFNFVLDGLKKDEWAIFMSDDYVQSLKMERSRFRDCGLRQVCDVLQLMSKEVERIGIKLLGLGLTKNEFYARNPYGYYGLVDGRMFAIKKTEFRFDESVQTIPDYEATAYHLKHYGKNLILNHYTVKFERYTKGGLGSIKQRTDQKIKDCATLVRLYPDNLKYADKPGQAPLSHLKVKR